MSKGREIDSIDRAVMVLGNRYLLQIAMAISVKDFFAAAEGGYSLCKGGIFKHSVGTGDVSKILAEFTGKAPANLAYTAGILHDLGKVVLDQHMAAKYPLFYQRVQEGPGTITAIERDLFGVSHTEAGARLARRWSLPKRLEEVIERHHTPEEASLDAELTCLVHIADGIMSRFRMGLEIEVFESQSLKFSLSKVGLSRSKLYSALALISTKAFGNAKSLA
jgi:putative nucleotidyltransferase with HDIG domain